MTFARFLTTWCSGFLVGQLWLAMKLKPLTSDTATLDIGLVLVGTAAMTLIAIAIAFRKVAGTSREQDG